MHCGGINDNHDNKEDNLKQKTQTICDHQEQNQIIRNQSINSYLTILLQMLRRKPQTTQKIVNFITKRNKAL